MSRLRNSVQARERMRRAMVKRPRTYSELSEISGLTRSTIAKWFAVEQANVHVAGWAEDIRGRVFVPRWGWWADEKRPPVDVPRPTPKTSAERMRRWRRWRAEPG